MLAPPPPPPPTAAARCTAKDPAPAAVHRASSHAPRTVLLPPAGDACVPAPMSLLDAMRLRAAQAQWVLLDGAAAQSQPALPPALLDGLRTRCAAAARCMRYPLMPHQVAALRWMLWRESAMEPLDREAAGPDPTCCGGLLADDMGLGKTVTTIALLLASGPQPGVTLVVCPKSLLLQWVDEMEMHAPAVLSVARRTVMVYYGPQRCSEMALERLAAAAASAKASVSESSDTAASSTPAGTQSSAPCPTVVLTTYGLLHAAHGTSPLLRIRWSRVVFDEAHVLRNWRSAIATCAVRVDAQRRWLLTGTAVHNSPAEEIYSYARVLHMHGFETPLEWRSFLGLEPHRRVAAARGRTHLDALAQLLAAVSLRRTKADRRSDAPERCIVDLPPRREIVHRVELSTSERAIYDSLKQAARAALADDVPNAHALTQLLRLRQACVDTAMVPVTAPSALGAAAPDDREGDVDANDDAVIELLAGRFVGLDLAGAYGHDVMAAESARNRPPPPPSAPCPLSSKIASLVRVLETLLRPSDGTISKCVVVSQWVSALDRVAGVLSDRRIDYARLDGRCSLEARQRALRQWRDAAGSVHVLLLSLTAGGVGLNLAAATAMLLLDNHWNPALEEQAVDRIHRIGQTRPVEVHRFICRGTVEEHVERMKERKRALRRGVLRDATDGPQLADRSATASGLSASELRALLV